MLISEIAKKGSEELIRESNDYLLYSVINSLILNIKGRLENKQGVYTYEQLLHQINRETGIYIGINNKEKEVMIKQSFDDEGMEINNSGEITLKLAADVDTEDPGEVEKQNKSSEIAGKAMDKIKGGSTDDKTIDGEL